ncbi:AcrR family transcriptional regulator [Mycolicibacterium sp. BK556]|uniref:TetR/AcrR family transcriptional regulator n=1 Tax=Mycobacteriaceae TaxID=1762 RepID=UPI00106188EE|nr:MULTISPECIES: TetR/AcrR family transcriptional regulator [Mycobacteriaceae]MBB3606282.1 AcrR family transcriptional regulator [Mycolicibacterium sp. BK556]MBB3632861.1 AcrR family transcriptional regulator [Mycolicibacterium sp. BK607]MBB3754215.1 AcrR family transcriptional regulator [Mycolicibacterium sp. BK634]TDO17821.1 TetR family transcriptional regulator [Mycobacterium sp. BK086]
MSSPVKRQYRSELRSAQARTTCRLIVEAAERLFAQRGYGATTIEAVATEAGVSRKTVFTAIGGKAEILKLAIDWAIAGDDEPIALQERPEVDRLLRADDPDALLNGWATVLVEIDTRVAALWQALDIAAGVDPQARELHQQLADQRLTSARTVVDRLAELGALRKDLSHAEARDIAWLASDPVLFDRLVRQRRWAAIRFERWLASHLVSELLGRTT